MNSKVLTTCISCSHQPRIYIYIYFKVKFIEECLDIQIMETKLHED